MNVQSPSPQPAPARQRLPNGRPSITQSLTWNNQTFDLTFGFNDRGRVAEVFGSSPQIGSDLAFTISDAAVAISLSLQAGYTLQEIARSMGQLPDPLSEAGHRPASVLDAILQAGFQLKGDLYAYE